MSIRIYWKPKVEIDNALASNSLPLDVKSRFTNNSKPFNKMGSNLSNSPSSSKCFADRTNHPIHCRLWIHKAHVRKPQVDVNVTIKSVYYVEGLNHNLFSIGQFCDADLKVAFRKSTCFVRDLQGNDLFLGTRGSDLYIISLQESSSPTPLCFMAKASPTQAWLWHHRLSHLNFDTINVLSKNDIVNGLPKLKYVKDQLCSSCKMGKAKRSNLKTKTVPSLKGRLHLLHMDLCGPMRVESINRKKYILTKDHPPEQVRGNPSKPVQTRRQLATDPEMCMFALTLKDIVRKRVLILKNLLHQSLALASIHTLIIHQMDVKTTFLNGELDAEVDLIKEFLSSRFSIKDTGEANVILGIRIKHKSNRIVISQSHYIEKVLKKFNYFDCTLVTTPMDTSEKLMPNNVGKLSRSAILKTICLPMAGYSCLVEVQFLRHLRSKLASPAQQESEFMALAAVDKEAEWLRNLILEIPLWSKPKAPISIRCDSAATLTKVMWGRCGLHKKFYNSLGSVPNSCSVVYARLGVVIIL
ncbi:retrovirus-related pol polyprotein from transposon TNT 1-94 [Tanacetum coccineum]